MGYIQCVKWSNGDFRELEYYTMSQEKMIDILFKIIQLGIVLNILLIVFVSIALFVTILNLRTNNIYEYNRIIAYSKTLKKVSNWQTVANVLIPFYGFFIYYKVIQIIFIDEYQSVFVKFKLMEIEVDKLRIFKRSK